MPSSGMWRRVDPVKLTGVSEELSLLLLAHAGSYLADFPTLKKEAIRSSESWFISQDLQGATSQKTAFFKLRTD
jgi:hypothetical protein